MKLFFSLTFLLLVLNVVLPFVDVFKGTEFAEYAQILLSLEKDYILAPLWNYVLFPGVKKLGIKAFDSASSLVKPVADFALNKATAAGEIALKNAGEVLQKVEAVAKIAAVKGGEALKKLDEIKEMVLNKVSIFSEEDMEQLRKAISEALPSDEEIADYLFYRFKRHDYDKEKEYNKEVVPELEKAEKEYTYFDFIKCRIENKVKGRPWCNYDSSFEKNEKYIALKTAVYKEAERLGDYSDKTIRKIWLDLEEKPEYAFYLPVKEEGEGNENDLSSSNSTQSNEGVDEKEEGGGLTGLFFGLVKKIRNIYNGNLLGNDLMSSKTPLENLDDDNPLG